MWRLAAVCLWSFLLTSVTLAQDLARLPVTLLADDVAYDSQARVLVARGNVEVLYQGNRLRATEIIYNAQSQTVRATGPIQLDGDDGTRILADLADLSSDLTKGLIEGARLLIDNSFQLASARLQRSGDGRFNTLTRTVASSCRVCDASPTPIWAIRADRIIQDNLEGQIYFEDARFDLLGVPVFYLPNLRIADPSKGRATGFLVPEFSSSDIYGEGVKLPYYLTLGDHADATLTTFATTDGGVLFDAQYRQALAGGSFQLDGTLAYDSPIGKRKIRGYLDAQFEYALPRDYDADFRLYVASDDSFLRQYGYSNEDRLTSFARISRYRTDELTEFRLAGFQSLRDNDGNSQSPFVLPEIVHRRVFDVDPALGRFAMDLNYLTLVRDDGDRNVARVSLGGDWRRDWTLESGFQLASFASVLAQAYQIENDPVFTDNSVSRVVPLLGVEARFPLMRRSSKTLHIIEPAVQIIYSDNGEDTTVPNEDSLLPELDETNLLALNRFPGEDVLEDGLRANIGVTYSRISDDGWSMDLTLGQVLRADPNPQFAEGSGLAGSRSDLVGALHLDLPPHVDFLTRVLINDDFDFRRAEANLGLSFDRGTTDFGLIYLAEDNSNPLLGPVPEAYEFSFGTTFDLNDNWQFEGEWRYDLSERKNISAEGRLSYGNECISLDLSLSRSFTTSNDVPPSTDIGLTVRLAGIGGAGQQQRPADRCGAL